MKVTVVGAGFYGSTLTLRIAEGGYADEVVMTDIVEGKPQASTPASWAPTATRLRPDPTCASSPPVSPASRA